LSDIVCSILLINDKIVRVCKLGSISLLIDGVASVTIRFFPYKSCRELQ